jgi:Uma2 family endonuclease
MAGMALANVHRFSTADFLALDGLPERVELIDGVICDMATEGSGHALAQSALLRALMAVLPPAWHVVAGGSIDVADGICPIPDAAVYRPTADLDHMIFQGRDAELVVEVGISSEWSDRDVKLHRYAKGGVPEVWLVVPAAARLSCHRDPVDGLYRDELDLAWPDGLATAIDRLTGRLAP